MAFQVILPKLTYEMQEGRILEWLCGEGDAVAEGQALFIVETDKASVEVSADQAGTLLKLLVPAGETIPVGAPVAWIGAQGEPIPAPQASPTHKTSEAVALATAATMVELAESPERPGAAAASPVARRLARELGVDLADVRAVVGQRHIREADVRAYAQAHAAAQARPEPAGPSAVAETSPDQPFELLAPSPLQRTMSAHLSRAAAIPQFSAAREVSLENLRRLRSELLAPWEASHKFRLTYTHLLAALVAQALKGFPTLNASWSDEGIRLYRTVDLGVAMASDRGLVVPVVRNADRLSLAETAAEIVRLQRAAERNRLLRSDLEGGTFTLTNVGMLGVELSIPLLNPPQSAILGIGAERTQVKLEDNRLWAIPVAWVTITADHRVVDGAAAAAFLHRLKASIEDPHPILLG